MRNHRLSRCQQHYGSRLARMNCVGRPERWHCPLRLSFNPKRGDPMKWRILLVSLALGANAAGDAVARELKDLKVLYVGSERASVYGDFLKDKVAQIDTKTRSDFKPADATPYDVVLLDWPQGPDTREMR